jgi:hypothetical protein
MFWIVRSTTKLFTMLNESSYSLSRISQLCINCGS